MIFISVISHSNKFIKQPEKILKTQNNLSYNESLF